MCLGRPQKMAVVFSCRSSHTQLVVKEEAGVVSWRENKRARSGVGEKREWGKERRGYATLSDDVTLPAPSVARPCGSGCGVYAEILPSAHRHASRPEVRPVLFPLSSSLHVPPTAPLHLP